MTTSKFIRIPRALLERLATDRRLTISDRRILDVALLYAPRLGNPIALSISMLEQATGITRRTVTRSRQRLVEFGYLIQHENGERGLARYIVATGIEDVQ